MTLNILAWALFALPLSAQENWLSAPNPTPPEPINQLRTSGNACGPACILDAFQCGSAKWQYSAAQITGATQAERLLKIIRTHGNRPSKQLPKQKRWTRAEGINATDLAAIGNEMRKKMWMGTIRQRLLFRDQTKSPETHLNSTHKTLTNSLKKGLPPILTARRMIWKSPAEDQPKTWLTVKRHYLVLTGLPKTLNANATSFPVTYREPWGGYSHQGHMRIPKPSELSTNTVILEFPETTIGKTLIQKGEVSTLSLSSLVGL